MLTFLVLLLAQYHIKKERLSFIIDMVIIYGNSRLGNRVNFWAFHTSGNTTYIDIPRPEPGTELFSEVHADDLLFLLRPRKARPGFITIITPNDLIEFLKRMKILKKICILSWPPSKCFMISCDMINSNERGWYYD